MAVPSPPSIGGRPVLALPVRQETAGVLSSSQLPSIRVSIMCKRGPNGRSTQLLCQALLPG
jgi:hypothetical protein